MLKQVNELGRLHKMIKDYINNDSEHNGSVAKALRFSLQEKINSYYVYVNNWVSNIFVMNISTEIQSYKLFLFCSYVPILRY